MPKPDPSAEELAVARAKFDHALYDQALADLKGIVARNPSSPSAPAAFLLMASTYERQNRPDDAAAVYIELRTKYQSSPAAPEGTFMMAELTLRSKRADREQGARELFGEIATNYPDSPWAPRALARKAVLEEQAKLRVVDAELKTSVPAALVSYRTLVERYPDAQATQASLLKLAEMYEDLRRYELAARSLDDLATRFPNNAHDAAWRAAELYEERVKDMDAARSAYARVPDELIALQGRAKASSASALTARPPTLERRAGASSEPVSHFQRVPDPAIPPQRRAFVDAVVEPEPPVGRIEEITPDVPNRATPSEDGAERLAHDPHALERAIGRWRDVRRQFARERCDEVQQRQRIENEGIPPAYFRPGNGLAVARRVTHHIGDPHQPEQQRELRGVSAQLVEHVRMTERPRRPPFDHKLLWGVAQLVHGERPRRIMRDGVAMDLHTDLVTVKKFEYDWQVMTRRELRILPRHLRREARGHEHRLRARGQPPIDQEIDVAQRT